MFVASQILAIYTAWSLDEEKNITPPPPLFFKLFNKPVFLL